MAAEVDEQVRRRGDVAEFGEREATGLRTLVEDEGRGIAEAELVHHPTEVGVLGRFLEGARPARGVGAVGRADLFHEDRGEAEPAQAEHPLEAGPGVAAVARLDRQGAGDERDAHAGSSRGANATPFVGTDAAPFADPARSYTTHVSSLQVRR